MTDYYDAWLASLANRDATIEKMFWMGLSLVGTWLFYLYVFPLLQKHDLLIIPDKWLRWAQPVILWTGQALYWGTIIYTWLES